MTSRAHYYINNEPFGDTVIDHDLAPCSWAFFCTTCGDIWARIIVNDGDETWQVSSIPCDQHRPRCVADANTSPGSLLSGFTSRRFTGLNDWPMTVEHLPHELLIREFLLRTQHVH